MTEETKAADGAPAGVSDSTQLLADEDDYFGEEPPCLVCGGEGWVEGCDHLDWQDDGYDDQIPCTSCKGSGLAKDMTWC